MSFGIVRTDKMAGTNLGSLLVSIVYMGSDGGTATAIENGNVLKVGALKTGEREVFIGGAVAASDKLKDVVLIATPEVNYDERKRNLENFINEAGKICRGYHLHSNDIFSLTKDALAGAAKPAVGDIVELAAGTKLSVVAAATGATSGSTVVGKIIAVDTVGKRTYYVIKVD